MDLSKALRQAAEQPPSDGLDWKKPNLAVIAQSEGAQRGVVLWYAGPHLASWIPDCGWDCDSNGLGDSTTEGIFVWEGIIVGSVTPSSPNGPEEYDADPVGKCRPPTEEEWKAIREGRCPWPARIFALGHVHLQRLLDQAKAEVRAAHGVEAGLRAQITNLTIAKEIGEERKLMERTWLLSRIADLEELARQHIEDKVHRRHAPSTDTKQMAVSSSPTDDIVND